MNRRFNQRCSLVPQVEDKIVIQGSLYMNQHGINGQRGQMETNKFMETAGTLEIGILQTQNKLKGKA